MYGDRGRISPAVSATVGTPCLLACKLPGDSSIFVSHLKVPVLILQMWTTGPGFLYGFQDSLQSSIRLAP